LDAAALLKLRLLTLVSLAHTNKHLAYSTLFGALGLDNVRELEDTVIAAVERGLVVARLDAKAQSVHVSAAVARDLRAVDLDSMIATLDTWTAQCEATLANISHRMEIADQTKENEKQAAESIEQQARAVAIAAHKEGNDGRYEKRGTLFFNYSCPL
jgi:hypothetical protein